MTTLPGHVSHSLAFVLLGALACGCPTSTPETSEPEISHAPESAPRGPRPASPDVGTVDATIRASTGFTPSTLAQVSVDTKTGPFLDLVVFTVPGDEYCAKFVRLDARGCKFDGTATSEFWEAEQRLGVGVLELDVSGGATLIGYRLLSPVKTAWRGKASHESPGVAPVAPNAEVQSSGRHELREARAQDFDGDGDGELLLVLEVEALRDSYAEQVELLDDAYVVSHTSTWMLVLRPDLSRQFDAIVAQQVITVAEGFSEIETHRLLSSFDLSLPSEASPAGVQLEWCEVDMQLDIQLSACEREAACNTPTHMATFTYDQQSDAYSDAEVIQKRPLVDDDWDPPDCD